MRLRQLGVMAWAAALLIAGAVALAAGWEGPRPALVLATAAVAPLALIAAGARLRVPVPVLALLVLGLAAALAYYLVLVPDGVSAAAALRDSVPRLLTTRRPAPPTGGLLLPGAALALLVGIWVALRTIAAPAGDSERASQRSEERSERGAGQRGDRPLALVAAPAGALVLYTAGALLTAGSGDRAGLLAGAIVVLSVGGWLGLDGRAARATRTGTGGRLRAAAGRPAAIVALAAIAAALAILPVPVDAFEPRDLVDPPTRTVMQASPLPMLAAWHERGDAELFAVSGSDRPDRVRLVTLSAFTGVSWSATATYRPIGVVGVPTLPPGAQRDIIDAEVAISGLEGIWLPGLGRPVDVSLPDVEYEADGGSLALAGSELRPGLRYRVRADVDSATPQQITAVGVPSAEAAGALVELPKMPWAFGEYARRATFGASTPFEQAVALEYAVREGRRYDPSAPVGSSYARLATFLFEQEESQAGAKVGSSEQFAAAFAVLARSVGLPSRVVLGFRPGPDGVVRGRDALAWPEVYFSGYGWYPFDPTPGTADISAEPVKLLALDRVGETAIRAIQAQPGLSPTPPAGPPTASPSPAPVALAPPAAGTGLLAPAATLAAAMLLALAVVVLLRGWRSLRHRRAGVRGAWSEVLDLLVLLGRPAPRSRPAPEIAADLATAAPARVKGPHPAVLVAAAADRATFAPHTSGTPGASPAWPAVRRVRRAVRAAIPLHRRLLWPIDPRPLRRRRSPEIPGDPVDLG